MLTISKRQMAILAGSNEDYAAKRIRDVVIRCHQRAIVAISDERLPVLIRTGIKRARAYGLLQLDSIMLFVLLMFEVAPGFDRQRDIFRHLTAAGGPHSDAAMLSLSGAIGPRAWDEAALLRAPEEWDRAVRGETDV